MTRTFKASVNGLDFSGKVARGDAAGAKPVIFAIHGGTYTADYFDVPGHSLIDRAVAQGFDVIAIDRPGYRSSTPLPEAPDLIAKNAEALNAAIPGLLEAQALGGRAVFLIGHSIGGAIALTIAADPGDWGLCGVAVSGVGQLTPPESAEAYAQMPKIYFVELPTPMKDAVMFGPEGTYPADMPAASHIANTHVPLSELTDITGGWLERVRGVTAAIKVPVHYRQGGHERLWITSPEMVAEFATFFAASPKVDAAPVADAGHCIDFHNDGPAFQDAQLAFAAASAGR